MLRRGLATIAVVAAAPAVAAPAAEAARYLPQPSAGGIKLVQEPPRFGFGAANLLDGLRWRSWGGASATSRGTLSSNGGIDARVKVRVSRVRMCKGKPTFTRIKMTRLSGSRIGALGEPIRLYC